MGMQIRLERGSGPQQLKVDRGTFMIYPPQIIQRVQAPKGHGQAGGRPRVRP